MSSSRFSIGHRLSLVLGTILILFLVSCLYGIVQLRSVTREMNDMLNNALATERLAGDWYRNITNGATRTAAIAKSSDPAWPSFSPAPQPHPANSLRHCSNKSKSNWPMMTSVPCSSK